MTYVIRAEKKGPEILIQIPRALAESLGIKHGDLICIDPVRFREDRTQGTSDTEQPSMLLVYKKEDLNSTKKTSKENLSGGR